MHVKRKTIPIQQTVSDIKHRLPPSLQHPFLTALRAYGLTWMLTTLPGLVGALIKMAIKSSKRRSFAPLRQFIFQTVPRIFHASVVHNGLPWLMTGAIASTPFFTYALERLASRSRQEKKDKRFSRWLSHHPMLARTMSIGLSMWLVRRVFPKTKTLEWTFFALVRASDITASRAADNPIVRRYLPKWLFDYGSVVVFTLACTEIMFAWFYAPHRLPRGYSKWISSMSEMDVRLLDALRAIRDRTWLYGKDTGINDLLGNYCRDLGLPYELGLPERGRIPCTVVHGGQPWGCEVHALSRFSKGFVKIFFLYLMVHGIPPMLFRRKQTMETLPGSALHILKASVRSSTFLGVFISSIWYTICLTRTRIGHQLLGVDQTRLDDTLGPLLGCMACGLSLLIENGRRRGEMALYVVPRALFSLLDRVVAPWYHRGRWWEPHVAEGLETLVFAVSMATILGAMHNDKKRVRSSVRGLLSWIMKNELEPEVDAKQAASLTTDDDML